MQINGLGSRLVDLRKKNNLTQKEMADKLNVSNQLISKWETDFVIPGLEHIVKICELFDVSLEELVLGKKKKEKKPFNESKAYKSINKTWKKIKSFVVRYKRQLGLSLVAFCSALFITAITLLSIYVFVPASNKQNYLNNVKESVYSYIEENNRFNIIISGKKDGTTVTTQTLCGGIDENGIDYKVYGSLGSSNEYMVDNVVYNNQYKTEYTGNIATIKDLFDQKLSNDLYTLLEDEYNFNENSIKYIRATGNGYFIKIDGNVLRDKLTETEKKDISYEGDLQGEIIIKNGIIEKIDLSITMKHKTSGSYNIQTVMEFSKEKPNITAGTSPWYHEEIISSNDFVAQTFNDYNTLNITTDSETHQRLLDAIKEQKIKFVNDKLWFTYHLSGLGKNYIVGLDVKTGALIFEEEIFNEYGFFYQDKFIVYNSSKLKMIDLQTQTTTEKQFGVNTIGISSSHRIIDGDYLIIQGNVTNTYNSIYYLIYNLKDNIVVGKTSNLANNENTFSTNVMYYNEVLYYIDDEYNFGYDNDTIYSFDFKTKTETKLVTSEKSIWLKYIDSQGQLYYYNYGAIYKLGSDFAYANGNVYEENDLIYITFGDELYVYDGEELIFQQSSYTPPEATIFDHKDVIFIDKENNLVYLKNRSSIYHGSFDEYELMANIWLVTNGNGQKLGPVVVDCTEDYVIASLNSNQKQFGIYNRLDVSRVYRVSAMQEDITSGSYVRLDAGNNSQVLLLGNLVYLLSQKTN